MYMRQLIRTTDELMTFVDNLLSDKKVELFACDTETQEFSDEIRCSKQMWLYWIGIYAWDKHQCYIVHSESIDYWPFQWLLDLLPVVFHNAKFDLQILLNEKIINSTREIKELHDTMLLSFLQDEEKQRHWLKFLAKTVLHIEEENITKFKDVSKKPVLKGTWTLFEGMMDNNLEQEILEREKTMWEYCMDDCRNTYDLY